MCIPQITIIEKKSLKTVAKKKQNPVNDLFTGF